VHRRQTRDASVQQHSRHAARDRDERRLPLREHGSRAMKRNRKDMARRAFLKGLGTTIIGLPLLELTHGKSWAAEPLGAGRRFITVFSHGGDIYNFNDGGYPTWFIAPGGTGSA